MPLPNTISQGVDKTITITLNYKDGTPIDLTKVTGLVIYLSYIGDDPTNPFLKYSLYMTSKADPSINLSQLGYKQMYAVDAKNGIVRFIINADITQTAAIGVLNFSGKIEYVDKYTDSGFYHKEITPINNFAEIVTAIGSNQINF
jgi:hypothetical protein